MNNILIWKFTFLLYYFFFQKLKQTFANGTDKQIGPEKTVHTMVRSLYQISFMLILCGVGPKEVGHSLQFEPQTQILMNNMCVCEC